MKEITKIKRAQRMKAQAPACCDSEEQWRGWLEVAANSEEMKQGKDIYLTFCSDCTPQYRGKMQEQGRCYNSNIRFTIYKSVYKGHPKFKRCMSLTKNRDLMRYCSS